MLRNVIISLPLLLIGGCGGHDHDHDHDHEEGAAGHSHDPTIKGAAMIELGAHKGQFEVFHNAEDGTLTLLVWDAHVTKGVQVKAESVTAEVTVGDETFALTCEGQVNALKKNAKGNTNHFVGTDARLEGASQVTGTVASITVNGIEYTDLSFTQPVTQ
ncbi:MAG: hypothetical protein O2816_11760 [Planctomycetota bacterium]|nr:hypothetical protein [Planctomycetota bacterium]